MRLEVDAKAIQRLVDEAVQAAIPGSAFGRGPVGRAIQTGERLATAQAMAPNMPSGIAQLNVAQATLQAAAAQRALETAIDKLNQSPLQKALGGLQVGLGAAGQHGAAGILGSVGEFGSVLKGVRPEMLAFGAAIGLATAAAKSFAEIGAAQVTTGGTGRQVAMMRALGGAVGIDPSAMVGIAHALRDQIATTAVGAMAGAQAGISGITPRGFGPPINEARIVAQMARALQQAGPRGAQQMIDRLPALEPLAGFANASKEMIDSLDEVAKAMDQTASPEAARNAMALNGAMSNLNQQWTVMTQLVGGPLINTLTGMLEVVNAIAGGATMAVGGWEDIFQTIGGIFGIGGGGFQQRKERGGKSPTEENTEEMKRNTEALRYFGQGVFGGGPRAQAAVPPGFKGAAQEMAIRAGGEYLGQF